MSDVNANIGVNIDTSAALDQLKSLQRQISQFHNAVAKSSEAAALAQRDLQRNFLNSVNSIGAFSAEFRTIKTTSESFTNSLEKNKFSMREYFRYAGASTKTFGQLFKSEYDTIGKVAEDRVKKLQTQYIKMGRDAQGAMKAIAVIPNQLDMTSLATQTQIAAQKQALFNQLLKQGSTNLLNFGKNTQWAGRQLMVGFTLPLMAVGSAAAKTFMQMEAQAIKFKKVYGDIFTPQAEAKQALSDIQALGKEFTKYGIAVSTTVGLAADAAAAGFKGVDLQRQTTEATRLSVLGQIDSQKALQTTITLQNAFGTSSADLANNIDFLNAVENQTVLTLDDITTAIPKVAPIIQQLGGNVKDLAFFLTAMKQGGVNASEGANALKSGLASLINPSTKARTMLQGLGIDIVGIVQKDKGDLKKTVIDFAQALDTLAPLQRAQAIEQMFGKFQFARLSTLFQNVTKDGTQAAKVLELAGASVQDLASLSNKELGITADSAMNKFKKSVEDLKVAIVPVGEAFLKTVTPILDFISKIADKFSNLSDGTKKAITVMVTVIGGLGPILLMTFGLLANGVANIIKLFLTLRTGYQKLTGQSKNLGEQTQYMTSEQIDAAAAAHSLNQAHATLTQQFTVEAEALQRLIEVYTAATSAAQRFALANPGMMVPPSKRQKFANNGIVHGPGGPKDDMVPIMASNGEAIIDAATVHANPEAVNALLRSGKAQSKIDLTGAPGNADRSSHSVTGTQNLIAGRAGIAQLTAEQIAARNARALAQIEANRQRRMAMLQPETNEQWIAKIAGGASTRTQKNAVGKYLAEEIQKITNRVGTDLVTEFKTFIETTADGMENVTKKTLDTALKQERTILTQYSPQSYQQEREQFAHIGSGIGVTARNLQSSGAITNKQTIDKLEQLVRVLPEKQLGVKTGYGFGIRGDLNNDLGHAGADLQEVITDFRTRGINKWKKMIEIGGGNFDQMTSQLTSYDQEVSRLMEAQLRGGKTTIVDTQAQVEEARTKAVAAGQNFDESIYVVVEDINQQAIQNLNMVGTELENVISTALRTITEVRLNLTAQEDALLGGNFLGKENGLARLSGRLTPGGTNTMRTRGGAGLINAELEATGQALGNSVIVGIARGTGSASDSKKAIKEGNNVINGFVHSLQGGQDEAVIAGEQLGNAGINGVAKGTQSGRRIATRTQGAPDAVPMSIITAALVNSSNAQEKNTKQLVQSSSKLIKMNNALQSGSFALMSLSGIGQMFGGTLGNLSNKVFAVSGALFALQTITQTLTSAKLLELAAIRANTIAEGMGSIAGFKGLFAEATGFLSRFKIFGAFLLNAIKSLGTTAKVAGIVIAVATALFTLNKAQQAAKEKTDAFGIALQTTTEQLKTLGDYFGVTPTISALQTKTGFAPGTPAQINEAEKFRSSDAFKKSYSPTIKALKNLNDTQATQVLNAKVFELLGAGFSKDQIKIIIQAIQQEAKRTNLKIDFDSVSLDKMPEKVLGDFEKQIKKFARRGKGPLSVEVFGVKTDLDKSVIQYKQASGVINTYLNGVSAAFKGGQINGKQFNTMFDSLVTTLNKIPDNSNLLLLINEALKNMQPEAAKAAAGIKDFSDKILVLKAVAAGLGDQISKEMIKALSYSGADPALRALKAKTEADIKKLFDGQITAQDKITKEYLASLDKGTSNSDTLSKSSKLAIAIMQKELDALKTKRDHLNEINDELKRQYDYQQKLQQLNQDALQAKISGNYIQAANLQQQKAYTTSQFNKETDSIALDKRITNLENQISAIQSTNRVTAAQKAFADSLKKADGGHITGAGTGTSDSIPAYLSNGEYVVKADSVKKYGVNFFDGLNAQKFVTGGEVVGGSPKPSFMDRLLHGNKEPLMMKDSRTGKMMFMKQQKQEMPFGPGGISKILSKLGAPVSSRVINVIGNNDSEKLKAVEEALMKMGMPKEKVLTSYPTIPKTFRSSVTFMKSAISHINPVKASTQIMRNLNGSMLESAIADGRKVPTVVPENWWANKTNPTPYLEQFKDMFRGPNEMHPLLMASDYGAGFRKYWGRAYDSLVKSKDPALKGINNVDEFFRSIAEKTPGWGSRYSEDATHPLVEAANKAFMAAHGLSADQPIALFKAARQAGTAGYSSISSKFARGYLKNPHLGVFRDAAEGTEQGLYKIITEAKKLKDPLGLGGIYDEFANVIPQSLNNAVKIGSGTSRNASSYYGRAVNLSDFYSALNLGKKTAGQTYGMISNSTSDLEKILSKIDPELLASKMKLPKFAKGGLIKGTGTGLSDSISAGLNGSMLPQLQVSNGEYIMNSSAVQKYGPKFMDAINSQKISSTTPVDQSAKGNVVYNNYVTVNGTDLNKKEVADEVIMRLNKVQKQNNKTNMVTY